MPYRRPILNRMRSRARRRVEVTLDSAGRTARATAADLKGAIEDDEESTQWAVSPRYDLPGCRRLVYRNGAISATPPMAAPVPAMVPTRSASA